MIFRLFFFSLLVFVLACQNPEVKPQNMEIVKSTPKSNLNITTDVPSIDKIVKDIDSKLSTYIHKHQEIDEGGFAPFIVDGYFNAKKPIKLTSLAAGEVGTIKTSFYIFNGEVVYVLEQTLPSKTSASPFTVKEWATYINGNQMLKVLEKKEQFDKFEDIDLTNLTPKDVTSIFIRPKVKIDNLKRAMQKLKDITSY